MYQRVEGQPSAEDGIRVDDGEVTPDGSYTRFLPRDYWGSLDSPPESRTSRLSFPDASGSLHDVPSDGSSLQPKLESNLQSSPVVEETDKTNPWTPGILARVPRLGFLAMIFNIMSRYSQAGRILPSNKNQ